jgi:hypothetical protein
LNLNHLREPEAKGTGLDVDPLDFLEREFLAGEIVELDRSERFVIGNVWA